MKTIIAGTDFTPASINACRYAALVAQKLSCKLVIFNLYQTPVYHSNAGLVGIVLPVLKKESKHNIDTVIASMAKDFPALKITGLVSSNDMKHELENYITKHQVLAVVMGLATKDRISKFIYGSNGVKLGGKLKVPVIIVPGKYSDHRLEAMLLAVDNLEKLSQTTSQKLGAFAKGSQLYVKAAHIRTPDEAISPATINPLKIASGHLKIEVLKAPSIENGVKKYCQANEIDLVAIISRKHSALYNLFSETVTKRIAFTSNIPVMAIHE